MADEDADYGERSSMIDRLFGRRDLVLYLSLGAIAVGFVARTGARLHNEEESARH